MIRCKKSGRFLISDDFSYNALNTKSSGTYQIVNKLNGKIYIGSTCRNTFRQRWYKHINELSKNKHCNPHLQNAWNRYGKDNFLFLIINEFENRNETDILRKEQELIDNNIVWGYDYNIAKSVQNIGNNLKFSEDECVDIIGHYLSSKNITYSEMSKNYNTNNITIGKILRGEYHNCKNVSKKMIDLCKQKICKMPFYKSQQSNKKHRLLTNKQALDISNNYKKITARKLSEKYNVSVSTIRDVWKKRTYKEIHI